MRNIDIKIPSLFVWDNFYLLARKKNIKGLEDVIGKTIYLPLFEEAPPTKITKFLIKSKGLKPNDFNFSYGKPFGRPLKIYKDFISGKIDVCVLREPEASYTIKTSQKLGIPLSIISYSKLWNEVYPEFGSFPNAGIFIKEKIIKKYPNEINLFLNELKKSIDWVNSNKKEAAKLSFDLMRQPIENIELFLERVKFEYLGGKQLLEKVEKYFSILLKSKILELNIDKNFLDKFRLNLD